MYCTREITGFAGRQLWTYEQVGIYFLTGHYNVNQDSWVSGSGR